MDGLMIVGSVVLKVVLNTQCKGEQANVHVALRVIAGGMDIAMLTVSYQKLELTKVRGVPLCEEKLSRAVYDSVKNMINKKMNDNRLISIEEDEIWKAIKNANQTVFGDVQDHALTG